MTAFMQRALVLLALLAAIVSQPLYAQQAPTLILDNDVAQVPLDASLELLLDTSGELTVERIEKQPGLQFAPAERGKRHLLGHGSLWLRFDAVIKNPHVHWRLTVPLPGVDDVTLYFRDAAGQWITQQAGDSRPMSSWAQPARYPVFSLSPEVGQTVRYFVQIRHGRVPYSALPRVVSDVQLINSSLAEHMVLGIYFGLAALVITLALANALAYRDPGFGTYALYIAIFAASQGAFTGVAGLYWWPQWPDLNRATVFLLPAAGASAMWFVRTVTMPRRFAPLLDRAMLALILLLPLVGLVDAAIPSQAGFVMLNSMVGISMVLVLVVVGIALAAGDYYTRWVAAGFLPVLLATLFPLLRNFGVIPSSFLSDYALLLGSAIEAPILFYGLHRRVSQRRDLTARASGLGYSDPLTGLRSATVFLGKLRRSLNTAKRNQQPFALLLVNLTNLASLRKSHGRDTADRAIVMAAARLRAVAQTTDTVARVGDTQFALLMEGPVSVEAANDVATKILASGLRPSDQLPDAEPLLFHIAIGHMNGANSGPASETPAESEACLARLLQAVKNMNNGSRKAIRLVRF
ncbi:diguanylate cyclase [Polaromonas sp. P1(28)-13]|nr:diguanylate cyclase [Polaromonas sp. P1(28)-13]